MKVLFCATAAIAACLVVLGIAGLGRCLGGQHNGGTGPEAGPRSARRRLRSTHAGGGGQVQNLGQKGRPGGWAGSWKAPKG